MPRYSSFTGSNKHSLEYNEFYNNIHSHPTTITNKRMKLNQYVDDTSIKSEYEFIPIKHEYDNHSNIIQPALHKLSSITSNQQYKSQLYKPGNTISYNKLCEQCIMIANLYNDLIQYNPHTNITNEQQYISITQLYHSNNQMILELVPLRRKYIRLQDELKQYQQQVQLLQNELDQYISYKNENSGSSGNSIDTVKSEDDIESYKIDSESIDTNQSINDVYKQIIHNAVTDVIQYVIQQIELQPVVQSITTNKLLSSTNNNSIFAQFRSTLTDFGSKEWLKW